MQIIMTGRPQSGIEDIEALIEKVGNNTLKTHVTTKKTVEETLNHIKQNPDETFLLFYTYADQQTRIARFNKLNPQGNTSDALDLDDDNFSAIEAIIETDMDEDASSIKLPQNLIACTEIVTDESNYQHMNVVKMITECFSQHTALTAIVKGVIAEKWGETEDIDKMVVYMMTNNNAFCAFMRIFLIKSTEICPDIYDAMKLWETVNTDVNNTEKPYD